jgi:Helix-turn-helix domain
MSIKAINLVLDHYQEGGSKKLVLVVLANWCNDNGLSLFPSIAGIAKKVRVSESQARRIVHSLIDEGYLQVIGNHNGGAPTATRRYRLVLSKFAPRPILKITPCAQASTSIAAHDPLHGCAKPLAPTTPESSVTINKATVNNAGDARAADCEVPAWLPKQALQDFLSHRQSLKKPMSAFAVKLLIAELGKLREAGHNPVACLHTAILNGWMSPYAPKPQGSAQYQTAAEKRAANTDRAVAEFVSESHSDCHAGGVIHD